MNVTLIHASTGCFAWHGRADSPRYNKLVATGNFVDIGKVPPPDLTGRRRGWIGGWEWDAAAGAWKEGEAEATRVRTEDVDRQLRALASDRDAEDLVSTLIARGIITDGQLEAEAPELKARIDQRAALRSQR